jgi:iron uptake system component EfeO
MQNSAESTTQDSPMNDPYVQQVNMGLAYFQKRADEQLKLTENLLVALKSGDINRARQAYVDARAPYEEIEVYAASFPEEDEGIDARPYAIKGGETSDDYRSIHRIEALIYRDNNLAAAVPYGEKLVDTVKSLIVKLNDPKNFNSSLNYAGMLALAEEVPSKKISSEEETWSDQSILIFEHNWIGIQSQFEPYKSKLDPAIAAEVDQAYKNAMATISEFLIPGKVMTKPYSSVSVQQRGKIVAAAYQYRDALAKAKEALKIPDPPET